MKSKSELVEEPVSNAELFDELALRARVENTISHRSSEYRRTPGKFIENLPQEIRQQLQTLTAEDAAAKNVRDETIKMMADAIDVGTRVRRQW